MKQLFGSHARNLFRRTTGGLHTNDTRNNGTFENHVTVKLSSGEVQVKSTREAAEMLLYDWPIGETGERLQARMACMKVLGGGSPPDVARTAFLVRPRKHKYFRPDIAYAAVCSSGLRQWYLSNCSWGHKLDRDARR
ncbi:DUF982 domain-containing protein [Mesorhizobium sp. M5C.F.Ca.ET.164.01.1.1]|uniref:DUF982 domain-containing protein n=1 Tax=Mesorhizobium sp. M5C.F.Ca.ET.164.01.1.1 TaxID=2563957 RepID=UPI0032B25DE7